MTVAQDEDDRYSAAAPYGPPNSAGYRRRIGGWNYRVISWPNTEPDSPEGQRILEIRRVSYHHRDWDSTAQFGDICNIESRKFTALFAKCHTVEELLVDCERRAEAVNRPVINWYEWRAHVDFMIKWRREQEQKKKAEAQAQAEECPDDLSA